MQMFQIFMVYILELENVVINVNVPFILSISTLREIPFGTFNENQLPKRNEHQKVSRFLENNDFNKIVIK